MFCVIKVIKGYCDVLDTKDGVVERVPQTFLKKRIVGVEGVCATSICALSNQDILDRQISVNKLMQVTLPIIEITVIVDTVLAKCMVKDVVSVDVPYGITSIGFADEKKEKIMDFLFVKSWFRCVYLTL